MNVCVLARPTHAVKTLYFELRRRGKSNLPTLVVLLCVYTCMGVVEQRLQIALTCDDFNRHAGCTFEDQPWSVPNGDGSKQTIVRVLQNNT